MDKKTTRFFKALYQENIKDFFFLLSDEDINVNAQDEDGNTPLHIAVKTLQPQVANALIKYGANVNIENNDRKTPLLTLLAQIMPYGYETPATLKLFLDNGADIMHRDCLGLNALHYAVLRNKNFSATDLMNRMINVDTPDILGYTPFLTACQYNQTLCEPLLSRKARMNIKTISGVTALHCLAKRSDTMSVCPDLMERVIKSGVYINEQDQEGNTALHYAAKLGYAKNIRHLLELGADIRIKNNKGKTAIDVFTEENQDFFHRSKNYNDLKQQLTGALYAQKSLPEPKCPEPLQTVVLPYYKRLRQMELQLTAKERTKE